MNPDEKFPSQSILTSIRGSHSTATNVTDGVSESNLEHAAQEGRLKFEEMG